MENLPEELIAKIFSYLSDKIPLSQVCLYFKIVAATQIRLIDVKLSSEKCHEIRSLQDALDEFHALKKLRLELSFDVNNDGKLKFCNHFSSKLSSLRLREMTFLNPFFDEHHSFDSLTSLTIENSDLSSSSNEIAYFLLNCCPKLKHLTIGGCSGFDIDALDKIGQNLNQTMIEDFRLLPTYSYFDLSQQETTNNQNWTIENLKALSIRSKLVVMKKNFVKHLIGTRSNKLQTLELIASLDLGENLVSKIIQNYPNLRKLSLGKGCTMLRNEDFTNLCNFYKNIKSLEFHFMHSDDDLNLRNLEENLSIRELTLGLTSNISLESLATISKCLSKVEHLNIVLYFLSSSNQEFLTLITKMFPNVKQLEFQRTGMTENMKFSTIKNEINSASVRPFDDIRKIIN